MNNIQIPVRTAIKYIDTTFDKRLFRDPRLKDEIKSTNNRLHRLRPHLNPATPLQNILHIFFKQVNHNVTGQLGLMESQSGIQTIQHQANPGILIDYTEVTNARFVVRFKTFLTQ